MLKSYLLIAVRTLTRERAYAFINVLGLSIGLACSLVFGLYVENELTYDQHFEGSDNIYRVAGRRIADDGDVWLSASVSPLLGAYLENNYSEVEEFVRFDSAGGAFIRSGDVGSYWDRDVSYHTDPNVFTFLTHNIIEGDPKTALTDPSSMAVSESFATMYFGSEDAVGKTIERRGDVYTITLVFADLPNNTHFKYDILINHNANTEALRARISGQRLADIWLGSENPAYTYVRMIENFDSEVFEQISNNLSENVLQAILRGSGYSQQFYLEPLSGIHFDSITERDFPRGNKFYALALATVTVFILLVACINYMILATARAIRGTKAIALQKILGARLSILAVRFISEGMIFGLLALCVGIVLADLAVNFLFANNFLGVPLRSEQLIEVKTLLVMMSIALVVGLISATYPAAYLSGLSANSAFRDNLGSGLRVNSIRKMLIFVQFLISISFVSCAVFMYQQMQYIDDRPLGFTTENRVSMIVHGADNTERLPAFISELKTNPNILNGTISINLPGEMSNFNQAVVESDGGAMTTIGFNRGFIDSNYLSTFDIELIEGRNLNSNMAPGDPYALVNETLVREMGWRNPIGKRIDQTQVIGVVRDFHFQGLHQQVEPLFMQFHRNFLDYRTSGQREGHSRVLTIAMTGVSQGETLEFIQQKWDELNTGYAFEYEYTKDRWDQIYGSDDQQMQTMGLLAFLCILIACLGLYSLSALSAEQRTREIGIRRVLGATATQIVFLLFRGVSHLIAIAAVIASFFSYLAVEEWLKSFYYRIEMDTSVFLFSTIGVLAIALFTVAIQSFKTANGNPVEALRYE